MHPVGSVSLKNSDTVPLIFCDTNWNFNSVDSSQKPLTLFALLEEKKANSSRGASYKILG